MERTGFHTSCLIKKMILEINLLHRHIYVIVFFKSLNKYLLWPLVKILNIQSCLTSAHFITFTACLLFVCFRCTLWCTSTFAVYCLQEQFSEVLDAMFEVLVKPQQHIIDQGDDGDNFYVIDKLVSDLKVPL